MNDGSPASAATTLMTMELEPSSATHPIRTRQPQSPTYTEQEPTGLGSPSAASLSLFATRGVEDTFHAVWTIFTQQWGLFLSINAVALALIYVISTITTILLVGYDASDPMTYNEAYDRWSDDTYNSGYSNDDKSYSNYSSNDSSGNAAPMALMLSAAVVEVILFYLIQCVADGANIRAVAEIYAGESPEIYACIQHAVCKLSTLFLASITINVVFLVIPWFLVVLLMAVIFMNDAISINPLGCILLFVLLYLLYVVVIVLMTYLTYPVIVMEHATVWGSIQRSMTLADGHYGYIFVVLLLYGMIKLLCNALVSSLLDRHNAGQVQSSEGTLTLDLNLGGGRDGIISFAFGTVFAALGSIFQAVIYFSIRVQKEGYGPAVLTRDLVNNSLDHALSYRQLEHHDHVSTRLGKGSIV